MKYKKPEMEIHEFEAENIVRTSYHNSNNPGDDLSDLGGEDW